MTGAQQARLEEWGARRNQLAAKLERLARVATQTAQGLRDGTPMSLPQVQSLQNRAQSVWEAIALERATRP